VRKHYDETIETGAIRLENRVKNWHDFSRDCCRLNIHRRNHGPHQSTHEKSFKRLLQIRLYTFVQSFSYLVSLSTFRFAVSALFGTCFESGQTKKFQGNTERRTTACLGAFFLHFLVFWGERIRKYTEGHKMSWPLCVCVFLIEAEAMALVLSKNETRVLCVKNKTGVARIMIIFLEWLKCSHVIRKVSYRCGWA